MASSWRCCRKESRWDLNRSPGWVAASAAVLLPWWSWWMLEEESKNWERGRNECEERDFNPRNGLDGVGEDDNGCGVPDFCGDRMFNDSGLLFFRGDDELECFTGVGA